MTKNSGDKSNHSEYYTKHDRFFDFLKASEMYKGIYSSKEGIISLLLSIILSVYIYFLEKNFPKVNMTTNLTNILGIILSCSFGLLGFLVGGMAIITGSIDQETISIVDRAGKYRYLLGIVFQFYYDGFIIGALIIVSLINYFLLLLPFKFNMFWLTLLTFGNSYLFFYSLILSIMLLGTAIRLMNFRHMIYVKIIKMKKNKIKKTDKK